MLSEVRAPEGVFIEGGAEGGKPEVERGKVEVGAWVCVGLAEG